MGKNETANPNVDNSIGIQDELGQEAIQQTIDNLKKEVQVFTDNMNDLKKGKENYLKQWNIDKELFEIQLVDKAYMPKETTFKYQDNPRFWELVEEKMMFKFRFDQHQAEEQLKAYDKQIETMQEQIDSSLAKLKEME